MGNFAQMRTGTQTSWEASLAAWVAAAHPNGTGSCRVDSPAQPWQGNIYQWSIPGTPGKTKGRARGPAGQPRRTGMAPPGRPGRAGGPAFRGHGGHGLRRIPPAGGDVGRGEAGVWQTRHSTRRRVAAAPRRGPWAGAGVYGQPMLVLGWMPQYVRACHASLGRVYTGGHRAPAEWGRAGELSDGGLTKWHSREAG